MIIRDRSLRVSVRRRKLREKSNQGPFYYSFDASVDGATLGGFSMTRAGAIKLRTTLGVLLRKSNK